MLFPVGIGHTPADESDILKTKGALNPGSVVSLLCELVWNSSRIILTLIQNRYGTTPD